MQNMIGNFCHLTVLRDYVLDLYLACILCSFFGGSMVWSDHGNVENHSQKV